MAARSPSSDVLSVAVLSYDGLVQWQVHLSPRRASLPIDPCIAHLYAAWNLVPSVDVLLGSYEHALVAPPNHDWDDIDSVGVATTSTTAVKRGDADGTRTTTTTSTRVLPKHLRVGVVEMVPLRSVSSAAYVLDVAGAVVVLLVRTAPPHQWPSWSSSHVALVEHVGVALRCLCGVGGGADGGGGVGFSANVLQEASLCPQIPSVSERAMQDHSAWTATPVRRRNLSRAITDGKLTQAVIQLTTLGLLASTMDA